MWKGAIDWWPEHRLIVSTLIWNNNGHSVPSSCCGVFSLTSAQEEKSPKNLLTCLLLGEKRRWATEVVFAKNDIKICHFFEKFWENTPVECNEIVQRWIKNLKGQQTRRVTVEAPPRAPEMLPNAQLRLLHLSGLGRQRLLPSSSGYLLCYFLS